MLWVNPSARVNDWVRVLGKGGSSPRNFGLWVHGTGKESLSQIYGLTSGGSFVSHDIPLNAWTHMACTWVKDGEHVFYLNGVRVGGGATSGIPSSDNEPITLGGANFHSKFQGKIRKAVVLKTILSPEEILSEVQAGPEGTIRHFKTETERRQKIT